MTATLAERDRRLTGRPVPGHLPGQFPGLNALRALAAGFVILGHIPLNQSAAGLPGPSWGAFFFRGQPAVLFFFTLSGFLITHLLLREAETTGTVSVRNFYVRRILRIWPLYFFVVALGLTVYKVVLPRLGIPHESSYSTGLALLLYTCFLPNVMNNLYSVGGILNPLWSIGIEEQFYLSWAPLVRRHRSRLPAICLAVLAASTLLFVLQALDVFGVARAKGFVGQLKFHFIAAGALAAWRLHSDPESLLGWWPFRSRRAQAVLLGLVATYYFVSFGPVGAITEELAQLVLYTWLVVNTAVNPLRVVGFTSRLLDRLGVISYGLYMLHMPVIYVTSAVFRATSAWHDHPVLYLLSYYTMAFGGTILAATLSYRWFESPFLRMKDGLGSASGRTASEVPALAADGRAEEPPR